MTRRLSARTAQITQAEIRAMSIECENQGGINLAQGVCDTELPIPVRRGVMEGIERGLNSYTRFDGLRELRVAISRKMQSYNGVIADPETQITVSAGSTGSFYCACLALLDPGDEVILFEPYYGYHVNTIEAVGAVPVYVPMIPPDWTFELQDLESAISERTKCIVINTPANPSGKVFQLRELLLIRDLAEQHDLFVFTDEIYEYFLYDRRKHISPASLPGMEERCITISGFSKTFAITGWRIGYSVCAPQWAEAMGHINDLVYVCAPSLLQYAVSRGLEELTPEFYTSLIAEYSRKRGLICKTLQDVGLEPAVPQGAYYVLADVSKLPGDSSKARAINLLKATGVASVPGEAFYSDGGKNLVRFCFAKNDNELSEACKRLQLLRQTI